MNETMTNQNAEQPAETGQEAAQEAKTFTQEEVNEIVQSRLSRYKGQASKEVSTEVEAKMKDLQEREMRLQIREKLDEKQMPRELADILTCTDEEDMNKKLDILHKLIGKKEEKPTGFIQVGASGGGYSATQGSDPVRRAMGLD